MKQTIIIEIDHEGGVEITECQPTSIDYGDIRWQVAINTRYVNELLLNGIVDLLLACKAIAPEQYIVKKSINESPT